MTPTDQQLVAMLAIGAIAAGEDEFVNAFGNQLLGSLSDAAIRRALRYVLARDGGDHVIRRLVKRLRRYAGSRPPHLAAALEELARANLPVRTTALRS
ncbi:MAG: hypothetical protein ACLPTZ_02550 [Beijerinckiaceae bacterium]